MSHFYGSMQGTKGEATRCGDKRNGIRSHIQGWDVGCRSEMAINPEGKDVVRIFLTSGSNGGPERFIGEFTADSIAESTCCRQ